MARKAKPGRLPRKAPLPPPWCNPCSVSVSAAAQSLRKAPPRRAKDWSLPRRRLPAITEPVYRAATFIAGGVQPPPDWLLAPLPGYVASLRSHIRADQVYPGRPELRRRLKAITAAAHLLEHELIDPVMLSLLLRDGSDWIVNENQMHAGLSDISARAEGALKPIPKKQGRAKHYSRVERLQNMDVCALIVTVAWKQARGTWPGVDNEQAKRACEALWGAAGGDVKRQGGGSIAVWRDHLRVAKRHRESVRARIVLRNFTEPMGDLKQRVLNSPGELSKEHSWYE